MEELKIPRRQKYNYKPTSSEIQAKYYQTFKVNHPELFEHIECPICLTKYTLHSKKIHEKSKRHLLMKTRLELEYSKK